jgi:tRNA(Ile)-lysidine synthase
VSSRSKHGAGRFAPRRLLAQFNERFPCPSAYCVAFSGGLDSTVLLHALGAVRAELRAPLSAIHVDHALQPGSADWVRHCGQQCRQLDVPLQTLVVDATAQRGESPEAAARNARYESMAAVLDAGTMLLTAHHLDDQAETLLLQLLRGAGVDGLAAMPAVRAWRDGWHARPLLGWQRAALRGWAVAVRLRWIEDPSNAQTAADRNYLRHRVLPVLHARWPAAAINIAQSAGLCAEAAASVRRQAEQDLANVRSDDRQCLRLAALCGLPSGAATQVLRRWLRELGAPPLPRRRMLEALEQLCGARPGAMVRIAWSGHELRRYHDQAWLVRQAPASRPPAPLDWSGDTVELGPGLGRLRRRLGPGGIDRDRWSRGRVEIRYRAAGLRCRPAGRSGSRSFKKLAQERRIPPWLRDRIPLIYIDGQVAAVAGVCVCEPFAAPGEEAGWLVDWVRD